MTRNDVPKKSTWFSLYLMMGLTSWLLTNSLFIEVPYYADTLPEGYAIASQISLLIQAANIFALVYVLYHKYFVVDERILIFFIQILSIATSILLAFCWDIVWENHSVMLLLLSLCSGIIGCLSVIIFYPFAAASSPFLTSAVSLGMGLTGLCSSILGIIQNIFPFSVRDFFLYNTIILLFSFAAFLLLCMMQNKKIWLIEDNQFAFMEKETIQTIDLQDSFDSNEEGDKPPAPWHSHFSLFLISCQTLNCFIYYLLLGSISYAVEDFEDGTMYLSVTFIGGLTFGSVGRFLCTFALFRTSNPYFLAVITFIQYILGIFVLSQCIFQWIDTAWIGTVVLSFILLSAINGYEDTLLYQVAAGTQSSLIGIQKLTRYIGLSNQAGAFSGSILSFLFIEFGWLS